MNSLGPASLKPVATGRLAPDARSHFASIAASATGSYVQLDGEEFYKISNSHLLAPFYMSLISGSDHWMYLASNGALSAGRKNADHALFPYYSDDKILDQRGTTGPSTIIRLQLESGLELWEPFAPGRRCVAVQNVYRNRSGSQIVFEEQHPHLDLVWRYSWTANQDFGFVRSCQLINRGATELHVDVVDGLRNVMPSNLCADFQLRFSNLADAYKRCERISGLPLALFYLSAVPSDGPAPSESLLATTVWSSGRVPDEILLSDRQISAFRGGATPTSERDVRGSRGSYWVFHQLTLGPQDIHGWKMIADLDQDHVQITELAQQLKEAHADAGLKSSQRAGEIQLDLRVAGGDGLQVGADRARVDRHRSNVTFNLMRGGGPVDLESLKLADWIRHLNHHCQGLADQYQEQHAQLPKRLSLACLRQFANEQSSLDLQRLAWEYLPLTFSRRHGDPTRPWNQFQIDLWQADGSEKLHYEGNWRDIFQNWEALGFSYPQLLNSMLLRFVNASTRDGHNPYRITKDGIDWERPDANDPWSNFGYWGDHQTIYQLKLIECARRFNPRGLDAWLRQPICVFADVPYRIVSFEQMLLDPRHTIEFDEERDQKINQRVDQLGADGQLLHGPKGLLRVNLFEKLLVSGLAQLTNLVPDAGLWLNTQRPEWNDANNALVGRGCSVVTAAYLRRYFQYLLGWLGNQESAFEITQPLADLARATSDFLDRWLKHSERGETSRRLGMEELQRLAQAYRKRIYSDEAISTTCTFEVGEFRKLARHAVQILDQTLDSNRRNDGLFHAYNLIQLNPTEVTIERLPEMLEGQVAILSSGKLTADESADVLDALRTSRLYRDDQQSYLLYPDREIPGFLDRNQVSSASVQQSPLAQHLLAIGDNSVIQQDGLGVYRFSGDLKNAFDLENRLEQMAAGDARLRTMVTQERSRLLQLFEETFAHDRYTGRSGTFFAYEGLGSIYWHMVSKLLLAVQERVIQAVDQSPSVRARLHAHYREIRAGLGVNKSPGQYGAFPIDPYSHTPAGGGAKQPGMTGQVKEDILVRLTELGIRIQDGQLTFDPSLFERDEALAESQTWCLPNRSASIDVQAGEFGFTYCGVPLIYQSSDSEYVEVVHDDGRRVRSEGLALSRETSLHLFQRTGCVDRIYVGIGSRGDLSGQRS